MNKAYKAIAVAGAVLVSAAMADEARADCTAPAAVEGIIRYDTAAKQVYFCDGTNWKVTGGGVYNVEVVTGAAVLVANLTTGSATAQCPLGKIVTGISCEFTNNYSTANMTPSLVDSRTGRCTYNNTWNGPSTIQASVTCATSDGESSGGTVIGLSDISVVTGAKSCVSYAGAPVYGSVSVSCPAGKRIVERFCCTNTYNVATSNDTDLTCTMQSGTGFTVANLTVNAYYKNTHTCQIVDPWNEGTSICGKAVVFCADE